MCTFLKHLLSTVHCQAGATFPYISNPIFFSGWKSEICHIRKVKWTSFLLSLVVWHSASYRSSRSVLIQTLKDASAPAVILLQDRTQPSILLQRERNTEHHRYRERTHTEESWSVCLTTGRDTCWITSSVDLGVSVCGGRNMILTKQMNRWLYEWMNDWTWGWLFVCLASNAGPLKSLRIMKWTYWDVEGC